MQRIAILVFVLLLFKNNIQAQDVCGSGRLHEYRLTNDRSYRSSVEASEREWREWTTQSKTSRLLIENGDTSYSIPVVFHIIHTGDPIGTEFNPSDSQIVELLEYVNRTFAAAVPDYADPSDGGVVFPVKFVLARKDPFCEGTTGILRADGRKVAGYVDQGMSHSGLNGYDNERALKDLSKWPTDRYYNIWIVNNVGSAGGFTHMPARERYDYEGTVIMASKAKQGSATLIHELGHGLGLFHTFAGNVYGQGGERCGIEYDCSQWGDAVCDTEPHLQNVSCEETFNVCTGLPMGTTPRNFMSFTFGCQDRFTIGQKERVMYKLRHELQQLATSLSTMPCSKQVTTSSIINVFPNPANSSIRLSYDDWGAFTISDIAGRVIMTISLYPSLRSTVVDIAALEEGIYVYKYLTGQGKVETGKLFVRR